MSVHLHIFLFLPSNPKSIVISETPTLLRSIAFIQLLTADTRKLKPTSHFVLFFCLPMCWDNALNIFVTLLNRSSVCMIYQDNYLLRSSSLRKTSQFEVIHWRQRGIPELLLYPWRSLGRLNFSVFEKYPQALLEAPPSSFCWIQGHCTQLDCPAQRVSVVKSSSAPGTRTIRANYYSCGSSGI